LSLIIQPNIADADAIYEKLIAMLEQHGDDKALRASARLILLLINHIGDQQIIEEAIERAGVSAGS
jgi:hypothetical protein